MFEKYKEASNWFTDVTDDLLKGQEPSHAADYKKSVISLYVLLFPKLKRKAKEQKKCEVDPVFKKLADFIPKLHADPENFDEGDFTLSDATDAFLKMREFLEESGLTFYENKEPNPENAAMDGVDDPG